MKYHDTGSQDPNQALALWFEKSLAEGVAELRIQSGYFQSKAIGSIASALEAAAATDLPVRILIGSNEGETLHSDVRRLVARMRLPRNQAKLGIVSFSNALFHPKVYHIKRLDGSQTAFVGSANFTEPGLTGKNVEAAISLDTLAGDSKAVLDQIADAIDEWFGTDRREGFHSVTCEADADQLLTMGVLAAVRTPRKPTVPSTPVTDSVRTRGKRKVLIMIPALTDEEPAGEGDEEEDTLQEEVEIEDQDQFEEDSQERNVLSPEEVKLTELECVQLEEFPEYFLFAPDATVETVGFEALSGLPLPRKAVGLIMQLKKANARKFTGAKGTTDINIPIAVAKTFRFGRGGIHDRPAGKVWLRIRFIGDSESEYAQIFSENPIQTGVYGYGYTKTEVGHKDIRMTMPSAVKDLSESIQSAGYSLPASGDFFLVEWPGDGTDYFGLSFIAKGSEIEETISNLYKSAKENGSLLGGNACLLPPNKVPAWPDVKP